MTAELDLYLRGSRNKGLYIRTWIAYRANFLSWPEDPRAPRTS